MIYSAVVHLLFICGCWVHGQYGKGDGISYIKCAGLNIWHINRRYCQVCTDLEPWYSKTHHFSVLENYAQNTKTKTKISDMEISCKHACYQMFVLFCHFSRFVVFIFSWCQCHEWISHVSYVFSIKKNTKLNAIWASGVSLQFITLWTLLCIQHQMLNKHYYEKQNIS